METSALKKLIAQGAFNYYSKHINIVCQLELSGARDLIVNIELFVGNTLKEILTIDTSEFNVFLHNVSLEQWLNKRIDREVERLKTQAYLSL